jgi:hypothetical protein
LLSLLGKGGSYGFQTVLSVATRPRKPQAILALARLAVDAIGILLAILDVATGKYDPELGIGLFSSILALVSLIPSVIVYQTLSRPRQIRLVGADCPHPNHWRDLATDRTRLSQGHTGAKPVRSTRDGLRAPSRLHAMGTRVRQSRISTPGL